MVSCALAVMLDPASRKIGLSGWIAVHARQSHLGWRNATPQWSTFTILSSMLDEAGNHRVTPPTPATRPPDFKVEIGFAGAALWIVSRHSVDLRTNASPLNR